MRKKQAFRSRIFKNNRTVLNNDDRIAFAIDELERQTKTIVNVSIRKTIEIDIADPFISIYCAKNDSSDELIFGYSKRMPNDVPNDRIAIQVAVSRLIRRLKEK